LEQIWYQSVMDNSIWAAMVRRNKFPPHLPLASARVVTQKNWT